MPETDQGLGVLLKTKGEVDEARFNGPYVQGTGDSLKDPWGNPFEYRSPSEINEDEYDLWSVGPGRRRTTAARKAATTSRTGLKGRMAARCAAKLGVNAAKINGCLQRTAQDAKAAVRSAFTLFEILLVAGLMAIIAAFAIPNFSQQVKAQQLPSSADQFRTLLALVGANATFDGKRYLRSFSGNEGRISWAAIPSRWLSRKTTRFVSGGVQRVTALGVGCNACRRGALF